MSTPVSHQPPQRQLALTTLAVVAAHAALLLGLPHLGYAGLPGLGKQAFVTRVIAPAVPTPQAANEAVAPEPEPESKPVAEPIRTVRPDAVATAPPTPPKPPRPRATPKPQPDTSAAAMVAGTALDAGNQSDNQEISLLTQSNPMGIGPFPPNRPVAELPEGTDDSAAIAHMKGSTDAPATLARAAEITYHTTGRAGDVTLGVPSRLSWRQDGRRYEASMAFYQVGVGERNQGVLGVVTPQGLAPVVAGEFARANAPMRFDYGQQRIEWKNLGAADKPLPAGAQDPLGALLQLGALLNGAMERYPVGTTIRIPVADDAGALSDWAFVVEAQERIPALEGKTLHTLRLTHQPEQANQPKIEAWLGSALEYLPVRLRVTHANGDVFDHLAQRVHVLEVPSAPR